MRHTRTAAYHTLGCKLNFSETSTLARSLEDAGYARVRVEDRPDVFVLNTCSVTENADKECRRHVRRFQAINPEAFDWVIESIQIPTFQSSGRGQACGNRHAYPDANPRLRPLGIELSSHEGAPP